MVKSNPKSAASPTYRKAVNKIADALQIDPLHTKYPSEDLDFHVDQIDEKSKDRALKMYRKGLKRGFINACDAILEGDLEIKDKTLYAPKKVTISVKIKFKGEKWRSEEFVFSSKELGFE
jgi:hypothetical protein